MPTDLTLSQEVETFLETLDWENDHELSTEERREAARMREAVKIIVKHVIQSREMLIDGRLKNVEAVVRSNPELILHFLDDYYTRELIAAVSGYAQRTLDLSRMEASRIPSEITNSYIQEASRTYILGLPQACIALCRAALEQSLKEQLGRQTSGSRFELSELINEAYKYHLLDRTTRRIAREVARDGNNVLHEKPAGLNKAYNVLLKLRGLVQQVYSAERHA